MKSPVLLSFGLLLGAAAQNPQPSPPVLLPAPPPIVTIAPPADPLAQQVRATGIVATADQKFRIEFFAHDQGAGLRVFPPGEVPRIYVIDSVEGALLLLADKRVSFLWPALLEWAGPSLERMRARGLAAAEAAYERGQPALPPGTTAESVGRPKVRSLLQYSSALHRFGHGGLAVDLLRRELAATSTKSGQGKLEYSILAAALGNRLFEQGRLPEAVSVLTQAESLLRGSRYSINAAVNRAALLAHGRRYAEALAQIDAAQAQFNRSRDKVPGSDRQFAWIRACALKGLGRGAEAEAAFAPALVEKEPVDRDFVLASNISVRVRGLLCMGDAQRLAAELLSNVEQSPFAPAAFIWLQPAYRSHWNRDVIAALRADPRLRAAAEGRMQILAPELELPLNRWRTP